MKSIEALAEIYRRTNQIEPLLKLLGDVVVRSSSLDVIEGEQKKILADDKLYSGIAASTSKQHHAAAEEADYPPLLAAAVLAAARKDFERAGEFFESGNQSQTETTGRGAADVGLGFAHGREI